MKEKMKSFQSIYTIIFMMFLFWLFVVFPIYSCKMLQKINYKVSVYQQVIQAYEIERSKKVGPEQLIEDAKKIWVK